MTLAQLPVCTQCIIIDTSNLRLLELGFCKNTHVTCISHTPLGGTALYELRQTRIALRTEDAIQIEVKAVDV